ncbi:MAG: HEAT repeat domain-containing protein [Candidatus Omnitrophica bacterium]|nr:HEAT repeat domain-containing protein [Candidatus Omnitrophota bacterium]
MKARHQKFITLKRVVSGSLTFAMLVSDISWAYGDVSTATLAPPLASKPLEGLDKTKWGWAAVEIEYIMAEALTLGVSKEVLKTMLRRYIKSRGTIEALSRYDIDNISEVRDNSKNLIELAIPLKRENMPDLLAIYNYESGGQEIRLHAKTVFMHVRESSEESEPLLNDITVDKKRSAIQGLEAPIELRRPVTEKKAEEILNGNKTSAAMVPSGTSSQTTKPLTILEAARMNISSAARAMGLHSDLKEKILGAGRVTRVKFDVKLDDGETVSVWGFRVLQNDARGAGKGGLRWLECTDETPEEAETTAAGLATLMSVKNAVIGVPYGGGKGDIFVPKRKYTDNDKARIFRVFSRELTERNAVGTFIDVPAPDKGTDARMMAWFMDEHIRTLVMLDKLYDKAIQASLGGVEASSDPQKTPYLDEYMRLLAGDKAGVLEGIELGAITGKPIGKGGSEGRTKATGFGGFLAFKTILKYFTTAADFDTDPVGAALKEDARKVLRKDISGMSVAIQGTGNVGEYAAWDFYNSGAKITMLQDVSCTIYNPNGIDLGALDKALVRGPDGRWADLKTLDEVFLKASGTSIVEDGAFWTTYSDIKVPAAKEMQITARNAPLLKCGVILELANSPTTPDADAILKERGILVVPDVLANVGGVTVSYFEWLQNIEGRYWMGYSVDKMLEERIVRESGSVLSVARKYKVDLRVAAYILSIARIADAEIARSREFEEKFLGNGAAETPYSGFGELGLSPDTCEELELAGRMGRYSEVIEREEKRHTEEVLEIARKIDSSFEKSRGGFILVSGPRTSGKMAFSERVAAVLSDMGRRTVRVDMDEKLAAYETSLIAGGAKGEELYQKKLDKMGDIINELRGEKPAGDDALYVIEGDYALSDKLLDKRAGLLKDVQTFGIFVNTATSFKLAGNRPLTSLDLRLFRHILTFAGIFKKDPLEIIREWPATRAHDLKYVYPAWKNADVTFNSYLAYELPVLKPYVEPLIKTALDKARSVSDKSSVKTIEHLISILEGVTEVTGNINIPADSIVRQFTGTVQSLGPLDVAFEEALSVPSDGVIIDLMPEAGNYPDDKVFFTWPDEPEQKSKRNDNLKWVLDQALSRKMVVVLGAGSADYSMIAEYAGVEKVILVDIVPGQLRAARDHFPEKFRDKVYLARADLMGLTPGFYDGLHSSLSAGTGGVDGMFETLLGYLEGFGSAPGTRKPPLPPDIADITIADKVYTAVRINLIHYVFEVFMGALEDHGLPRPGDETVSLIYERLIKALSPVAGRLEIKDWSEMTKDAGLVYAADSRYFKRYDDGVESVMIEDDDPLFAGLEGEHLSALQGLPSSEWGSEYRERAGDGRIVSNGRFTMQALCMIRAPKGGKKEDFIKAARDFSQKRNDRAAIVMSDKALELDAVDPQALFLRARALSFLGDMVRAKQAFKRLIEVEKSASNFYMYAAVLFSLGHIDEAIRQIERAIKINPLDPRNYSFLSKTAMASGDLDRALWAASKAVQLAPKGDMNWSDLAEVRCSRGEYEEALEAADKAIELDDNLSRSVRTKARLLAQFGRLDEALTAVNGLISKGIKDDLVIKVKGQILSAVLTRAHMLHGYAGLGKKIEELKKTEGERWNEIAAHLPANYKRVASGKPVRALPRVIHIDKGAIWHIEREHLFDPERVQRKPEHKTFFPKGYTQRDMIGLLNRAAGNISSGSAKAVDSLPDGSRIDWWPSDHHIYYASSAYTRNPLRLGIVADDNGAVITANLRWGEDVQYYRSGHPIYKPQQNMIPGNMPLWNKSTRRPLVAVHGNRDFGFTRIINSPDFSALDPIEREQLIWLAAVEGKMSSGDEKSVHYTYEIPFAEWRENLGAGSVTLKVGAGSGWVMDMTVDRTKIDLGGSPTPKELPEDDSEEAKIVRGILASVNSFREELYEKLIPGFDPAKPDRKTVFKVTKIITAIFEAVSEVHRVSEPELGWGRYILNTTIQLKEIEKQLKYIKFGLPKSFPGLKAPFDHFYAQMDELGKILEKGKIRDLWKYIDLSNYIKGNVIINASMNYAGEERDGFIKKGTKAWAKFVEARERIKGEAPRRIKEKRGECKKRAVRLLGRFLESEKKELSGALSPREIPLLEQAIVRFKASRAYDFKAAEFVEERQDFVLGHYTGTENEYFIGLDLIAYLEKRGPPSLVDEYLVHEVLCNKYGHKEAIAIQKKWFPEHYKKENLKEGANEEKGLLGYWLVSFIKDALADKDVDPSGLYFDYGESDAENIAGMPVEGSDTLSGFIGRFFRGRTAISGYDLGAAEGKKTADMKQILGRIADARGYFGLEKDPRLSVIGIMRGNPVLPSQDFVEEIGLLEKRGKKDIITVFAPTFFHLEEYIAAAKKLVKDDGLIIVINLRSEIDSLIAGKRVVESDLDGPAVREIMKDFKVIRFRGAANEEDFTVCQRNPFAFVYSPGGFKGRGDPAGIAPGPMLLFMMLPVWLDRIRSWMEKRRTLKEVGEPDLSSMVKKDAGRSGGIYSGKSTGNRGHYAKLIGIIAGLWVFFGGSGVLLAATKMAIGAIAPSSGEDLAQWLVNLGALSLGAGVLMALFRGEGDTGSSDPVKPVIPGLPMYDRKEFRKHTLDEVRERFGELSRTGFPGLHKVERKALWDWVLFPLAYYDLYDPEKAGIVRKMIEKGTLYYGPDMPDIFECAHNGDRENPVVAINIRGHLGNESTRLIYAVESLFGNDHKTSEAVQANYGKFSSVCDNWEENRLPHDRGSCTREDEGWAIRLFVSELRDTARREGRRMIFLGAAAYPLFVFAKRLYPDDDIAYFHFQRAIYRSSDPDMVAEYLRGQPCLKDNKPLMPIDIGYEGTAVESLGRHLEMAFPGRGYARSEMYFGQMLYLNKEAKYSRVNGFNKTVPEGYAERKITMPFDMMIGRIAAELEGMPRAPEDTIVGLERADGGVRIITLNIPYGLFVQDPTDLRANISSVDKEKRDARIEEIWDEITKFSGPSGLFKYDDDRDVSEDLRTEADAKNAAAWPNAAYMIGDYADRRSVGGLEKVDLLARVYLAEKVLKDHGADTSIRGLEIMEFHLETSLADNPRLDKFREKTRALIAGARSAELSDEASLSGWLMENLRSLFTGPEQKLFNAILNFPLIVERDKVSEEYITRGIGTNSADTEAERKMRDLFRMMRLIFLYNGADDLESLYDNMEEQRELFDSGKNLECGPGYLYSGLPDIGALAGTGRIDGKINVTRVAESYGFQVFNSGNIDPGIVVLKTQVFNAKLREGNAAIAYAKKTASGASGAACPDWIGGTLTLDDIAEIWVSENTYLRYAKILGGKIKVIPGLRHEDIENGFPGYLEAIHERVAAYMEERGLLVNIVLFRAKDAALSGRTTPHKENEYADLMPVGVWYEDIYKYVKENMEKGSFENVFMRMFKDPDLWFAFPDHGGSLELDAVEYSRELSDMSDLELLDEYVRLDPEEYIRAHYKSLTDLNEVLFCHMLTRTVGGLVSYDDTLRDDPDLIDENPDITASALITKKRLLLLREWSYRHWNNAPRVRSRSIFDGQSGTARGTLQMDPSGVEQIGVDDDGAGEEERAILRKLPGYRDKIYSPKTLLLGSGQCSLRCKHCLQGKVLSNYLRRHKKEFRKMLIEADKAGIADYGWCIGEPFEYPDFFYEMLGAMCRLKNVNSIGFVTNASFADTLDNARKVLADTMLVVGGNVNEESAIDLHLDFSWDREHIARGITADHVINLLRAVGEEWGGGPVKMQTVPFPNDDSVTELLSALKNDGLIGENADIAEIAENGTVELTNGITLSIYRLSAVVPEGAAAHLIAGVDYEYYAMTREAMESLPGRDRIGYSFTRDKDGRMIPFSQELVLGPDGKLYLNDKFAIRKSVPLAYMTDIGKAIDKVNTHPVLRALVSKGFKSCIDAYSALPEEAKKIKDIYGYFIGKPNDVALLSSMIFDDSEIRDGFLKALIPGEFSGLPAGQSKDKFGDIFSFVGDAGRREEFVKTASDKIIADGASSGVFVEELVDAVIDGKITLDEARDIALDVEVEVDMAGEGFSMLSGQIMTRYRTRVVESLGPEARRLISIADMGNDMVHNIKGHLVLMYRQIKDDDGLNGQLSGSREFADYDNLMGGRFEFIHMEPNRGYTRPEIASPSLEEKIRYFGTVLEGIKGLKAKVSAMIGAGDTGKALSVLAENLDIVEKNARGYIDIARSMDMTAGKKEVNVAALLEPLVGALNRPKEKARYTIRAEYGADIPLVLAEPMSLQQVFLNIMDNAINALDKVPEAELTINVSRDGDDVVVKFKDNGKGIEAGDIGRIFDRYFTTRKSSGGTGLGLSHAKEVTTALGGTIGVVSEPGKGAEFTIRLPAANIAGAPNNAIPSAEAVSVPAASDPAKMIEELCAMARGSIPDERAGEIIKKLTALGTERPDVQSALLLYSRLRNKPLSGLFDNYHIADVPVRLVPAQGVKFMQRGDRTFVDTFGERKVMFVECHPDDAMLNIGELTSSLFRSDSVFVTGVPDPAGVSDDSVGPLSEEYELQSGSGVDIKTNIRAFEAEKGAWIMLARYHIDLKIEWPIVRAARNEAGALLSFETEFAEPSVRDRQKVDEIVKKYPDKDIYMIPSPFSNHPHHRALAKLFLNSICRFNSKARIFFYDDDLSFKQHDTGANVYFYYGQPEQEFKDKWVERIYDSQIKRRGPGFYAGRADQIAEAAADAGFKEMVFKQGEAEKFLVYFLREYKYAERLIEVKVVPKSGEDGFAWAAWQVPESDVPLLTYPEERELAPEASSVSARRPAGEDYSPLPLVIEDWSDPGDNLVTRILLSTSDARRISLDLSVNPQLSSGRLPYMLVYDMNVLGENGEPDYRGWVDIGTDGEQVKDHSIHFKRTSPDEIAVRRAVLAFLEKAERDPKGFLQNDAPGPVSGMLYRARTINPDALAAIFSFVGEEGRKDEFIEKAAGKIVKDPALSDEFARKMAEEIVLGRISVLDAGKISREIGKLCYKTSRVLIELGEKVMRCYWERAIRAMSPEDKRIIDIAGLGNAMIHNINAHICIIVDMIISDRTIKDEITTSGEFKAFKEMVIAGWTAEYGPEVDQGYTDPEVAKRSIEEKGRHFREMLPAIQGLQERVRKCITSGIASEELGTLLMNLRIVEKNLLGYIDIARSQEMKASKEAVNVVDLLEPLVGALSRPKEKKRYQISAIFDRNVPPVLADPLALQQVFLNIMNNATIALHDARNGWLSISVKSENGEVVITFSDNGPGISPENIHRIFDPYFTTRKDSGGTGLGLSHAKEVTTALGGTIEVASELRKGAKFTIRLPAAEKDLSETFEKRPGLDKSSDGNEWYEISRMREASKVALISESWVEKMAGDDDLGMRISGAMNLGALFAYAPKKAALLLRCALADGSDMVREQAAANIGEMCGSDPEGAQKLLEAALSDPEENARAGALRSLPKMMGHFREKTKALSLLEKGMNDPSTSIRTVSVHAIKGLTAAEPEKAKELLVKALADEKYQVRCEAYLMIGDIFRDDPEMAKDILEKGLLDDIPYVRLAAMTSLPALYSHYPAYARAKLEAAIESGDKFARSGAVMGLDKVYEYDRVTAERIVRMALGDEEFLFTQYKVLNSLLKTLFSYDPAKGEELFFRAINHPDDNVRVVGMQNIGPLIEYDYDKGIGVYRKAAFSHDMFKRGGAANGLPQLFKRDPALAEKLMFTLIGDEEWFVKTGAAQAIPAYLAARRKDVNYFADKILRQGWIPEDSGSVLFVSALVYGACLLDRAFDPEKDLSRLRSLMGTLDASVIKESEKRRYSGAIAVLSAIKPAMEHWDDAVLNDREQLLTLLRAIDAVMTGDYGTLKDGISGIKHSVRSVIPKIRDVFHIFGPKDMTPGLDALMDISGKNGDLDREKISLIYFVNMMSGKLSKGLAAAVAGSVDLTNDKSAKRFFRYASLLDATPETYLEDYEPVIRNGKVDLTLERQRVIGILLKALKEDLSLTDKEEEKLKRSLGKFQEYWTDHNFLQRVALQAAFFTDQGKENLRALVTALADNEEGVSIKWDDHYAAMLKAGFDGSFTRRWSGNTQYAVDPRDSGKASVSYGSIKANIMRHLGMGTGELSALPERVRAEKSGEDACGLEEAVSALSLVIKALDEGKKPRSEDMAVAARFIGSDTSGILNKELLNDLKALSAVGTTYDNDGMEHTFRVTSDPNIFMRSGLEPYPTCQRCIARTPQNKNGQLINRIRYGQFKLAQHLIGNTVVIRTHVEVTLDGDGKPVLLVETFYQHLQIPFDEEVFRDEITRYAASIGIDRIYWAEKPEDPQVVNEDNPRPLTIGPELYRDHQKFQYMTKSASFGQPASGTRPGVIDQFAGKFRNTLIVKKYSEEGERTVGLMAARMSELSPEQQEKVVALIKGWYGTYLSIRDKAGSGLGAEEYKALSKACSHIRDVAILAERIKLAPGSGNDMFLALGVRGRAEEITDPAKADIVSVESSFLGEISGDDGKKDIRLRMWQNDPASVVYGHWRERPDIWKIMPCAVRGAGETLMAWAINALDKGIYPDLKGAGISFLVPGARATMAKMGFKSKKDAHNLRTGQKRSPWTYDQEEMNEGLRTSTENTVGILTESAIKDPSAADHLASLIESQGQKTDIGGTSEDLKHVRGFAGFLKMAQANSGTKIAFIALGRDWIDKAISDHAQKDEVNSMIRAIRLFCEDENIPFFYVPKNDRNIIGEIRALKSGDISARGIVLAGEETITGIETMLKDLGLKDDDRVTLATVDGSRLNPDSFIRLVEMFEVLFELFVQPGAAQAIKDAHDKLKFETVGGRISRIIFIPDAEPLGEDIEELRLRYRLQIAA